MNRGDRRLQLLARRRVGILQHAEPGLLGLAFSATVSWAGPNRPDRRFAPAEIACVSRHDHPPTDPFHRLMGLETLHIYTASQRKSVD